MTRETASSLPALVAGDFLLVARGDTQAALGVPFDRFERGWQDFVTARYL